MGLAYHSLNYFYRKKFGTKVRKLSLDAGCGCPNRDGTLATLGCIFCDPESFSPSRRADFQPLATHGDCPNFRGAVCENGTVPFGPHHIAKQIDDGIARLKRRYPDAKFIAYFQPGTNTYGPVDSLRLAYQEAASHPDVVGLAVGTRPDCAGDEILDVLAELNSKTWVVIEYGLQTIHDRSLDLLNRGHHFDAFLDAYRRTRMRNLDIGVHVILGLPGESRDDMLATARQLAQMEIHSVKLHNLYAVHNTVLADRVADGSIRLPGLDEYVQYAVDFLEILPADVVVERLCGDAPPEYLIGPSWCLDKAAVRAAILEEFRRRGTRQGQSIRY